MHYNQFDECPATSRQCGVTARTELETPHGSMRLEDIGIGDVVLTDAGFEPVRRILRVPVRSPSMARPVRFRGSGHCDVGLLVAPCQVIRVRDDRLSELFGLAEVGVQARFLIGWRGVTPAHQLQTTYYQLAFDLPRIVWAQGGLFTCGTSADVSDASCPLVVLSASQACAWRSGDPASRDLPRIADKLESLA